ncbi:unnamed protein product [Arctogadus glacialis]
MLWKPPLENGKMVSSKEKKGAELFTTPSTKKCAKNCSQLFQPFPNCSKTSASRHPLARPHDVWTALHHHHVSIITFPHPCLETTRFPPPPLLSHKISSSPVRGWLSASSHRDALHSVIRLVPLQPELSTLVVGLSNTHISGYGALVGLHPLPWLQGHSRNWEEFL